MDAISIHRIVNIVDNVWFADAIEAALRRQLLLDKIAARVAGFHEMENFLRVAEARQQRVKYIAGRYDWLGVCDTQVS